MKCIECGKDTLYLENKGMCKYRLFVTVCITNEIMFN